MARPKVLITGFNKNQCTRKFYLRQQLKVVPSHYSLWNCLDAMGFDVDQRMVEIGENLDQYEHVIVFIAGPRQLVATTVFEGLWAISQHPTCILAFDDWQVPDLFKGVAKCANWDELTAPFILDVNKKTVEELKPYRQLFLGAVKVITDKTNRMLISAFQTGHLNDLENYGPHLLFDKIKYPRDRLFVYNPNPYTRNRKWGDTHHEGEEDRTWTASPLSYTVGPPPAKERRFNFASLVQSKTKKWLKKQGFVPNSKDDECGSISGWPVDLYGSKADTQKRLTEDQMVQTIARDWGCLMPGYEHAGSGWWRARPLQCADANSILIGEDKELMVYYGKDYSLYGLTAAMLTELGDKELRMVADEQATRLEECHPLDKKVQRTELEVCLNATP